MIKKVDDVVIEDSVSSVTYTTSTKVGMFKVYGDVETPEYHTHDSACFDIKNYLGKEVVEVTCYASDSTTGTTLGVSEIDGQRGILLNPGDRVLIPSGLVMDIPSGYCVKLYPRSGTSLKQGITLANNVAVIDSDYVEQTFLLITNRSNIRQFIKHGERYVQAELCKVEQAEIEVIKTKPSVKTNRVGGMGHTGK